MNENIIAKKVLASLSEDKIKAFNSYLWHNLEKISPPKGNNKSDRNDFYDFISFDDTNNIAKYCDYEYYILTDDEANEMALEEIQSLVDDAGITAIRGYEHFIDEHYFDDAQQEEIEAFCWEIKDENDIEFGNGLVRECYEKGVIDDTNFEEDEEGQIDYTKCSLDVQQLIDRYVEYRCEENSFDYITGGEKHEINYLVKNNPNCVDWEGLVEYVISNDGRGSIISSYDGYENQEEYNGEYYYIYRIN